MVRHKAKPKYMFLWADRVDRGQKIIKAVRKIRNGGGGEGKGREGKGRRKGKERAADPRLKNKNNHNL